jgi:quinol monooxygenase YgiN
MLCALTVRRLKPGTFDQFREAFMAPITSGAPPEGMVRFDMLRNTADPDEVVCFGFFDGTAEQLRSRVSEFGYDEQMRAIAPFVESVGADGFFDIVEELTP